MGILAWVRRVLAILSLAVIALVIGLIVRDSFFATDSLELLVLRNVDDLTMHRLCGDLLNLIASHDWIEVLGYNIYAYGNIFWLPFASLSQAFISLGAPDWLLIVWPRLLSVAAFIACLTALYKISRARHCSRLNSLLGLLLVISCPAPLFYAKIFHNYMFIPVFVLWSLYFLSLKPTRRNLFIACVIYGLGVGMKSTALCAAPIFFLFLNRDLKFSGRFAWRHLISRNCKALAVVAGAGLVAFSPTVLLLPFGITRFFQCVIDLYYWTRVAAGTPPSLLQDATNLFFLCHYSAPVIISIFLGSLFLIYRNHKKTFDAHLIPLSCLLSLLGIFIISRMVGDARGYLAYTLPLIFILPLLLVELTERWRAPWLLILFAATNYHLNYYQHYEDLHYNFLTSTSDDYQLHLKKLNKLKAIVPSPDNHFFIVDSGAVFPSNSVRNSRNTKDFFSNLSDSELNNADVFVMRKESNLWKFPCDKSKVIMDLTPLKCEKIKGTIAGVAPYEIIYDDDELRAVLVHH